MTIQRTNHQAGNEKPLSIPAVDVALFLSIIFLSVVIFLLTAVIVLRGLGRRENIWAGPTIALTIVKAALHRRLLL
jgi:hypothetical protein